MLVGFCGYLGQHNSDAAFSIVHMKPTMRLERWPHLSLLGGHGRQYLVLCDAVACTECRSVHWKSLCVEMRQPSLFSKHTMILGDGAMTINDIYCDKM